MNGAKPADATAVFVRCACKAEQHDRRVRRHTLAGRGPNPFGSRRPYRDWEEGHGKEDAPQMDQKCFGKFTGECSGTTVATNAPNCNPGPILSICWNTFWSKSIPRSISQSVFGPFSEFVFCCGPPPGPCMAAGS